LPNASGEVRNQTHEPDCQRNGRLVGTVRLRGDRIKSRESEGYGICKANLRSGAKAPASFFTNIM